MLGGEACVSHCQIAASCRHFTKGGFGDVEDEEGVPPHHLRLLAACRKPLTGVLPDRLEHPEALCRVAEEALVDQRLQRVEVHPGDRVGRLHRAAAAEDGQSGEQPLLVGLEQFVAPLDGGAQRLLARIGVPPALEQVEPPRQPLEDLLGRQHARARRRQLQGEREVVQAAAKLDDGVVRRQPRALAEQLHRLRLRERRNRVVDLTVDTQELPAGDHQLQVRAALQQPAELRRRRDHLLEVVEQHE